MKNLSLGAHASFLVLIFSMVLTGSRGLRITHPFSLGEKGRSIGDQGHLSSKEEGKEEVGMELYPTGGSSLPDCSHACGPCFPCKRVIVSFKCSTEACPIVYRCMCKGKYYHVPSN
ncbi:protein EPIDERMAL PATTERNING FACTOR 2 [Alnus glutinosa]|uniref:protein EPIDERMAL PATTERNING FACTOR 2 n=1 Tax=Alnus glutinosa TaxID=3517 RepID=UPI002D7688DF|nr:protein EPIDERMAL PATTERNING FACTOR 2 [Alnus glutinosa]